MYKQQQHSKRLKDTLIYIKLGNLLQIQVVNIVLRETEKVCPYIAVLKKLFWFIYVSDSF